MAHVRHETVSSADGVELPLALPDPSLRMEQDTEWCLVRVDGEWQEVRFHDYDRIFEIEGLYERLFYDVLRCQSPATICGLLAEAVAADGASPEDLRVLDLGAGNGIMAEELAGLGAESVVGVDIIPEAAAAAERDRPGVYDDYLVADMTDLEPDERERLVDHQLNCLTCVAALGFGDIPPDAFTEALALVDDGGWIAFNIKEDFLASSDRSGFARLVESLVADGALEIRLRRRYRHRDATNGEPLHYVGMVGVKSGG